MSGGGGGSGNDGSNDMQVSGAEAAYSTEKGISTHADTQISDRSFSPGGGDGPSYGHGEGQVDPGFQQANTSPRADTSTVGIAARDSYSDREIERGYTDDGKKLSNVNGTYMTKEQMYNTGIIEKDPNTGQDVQGRYTVNANTGELERTDMSFADHWNNAPGALKYSPTLRLLYAGGKNIGEWMSKKGFKGYNEAGARGKLGNAMDYYNEGSSGNTQGLLGGNNERDVMNALAPEAPYIVSGIQRPTNSPAAQWYQSLGNTSTSGFNFSFANELSAAKAKQASILGNQSAVGWLAVNQSPFYNFLKERKLDKGIL